VNLGSFRILLPFFWTSWGVGILNSAVFNSFHNWGEFSTILEGLRNFGGGGGVEPPKPPPPPSVRLWWRWWWSMWGAAISAGQAYIYMADMCPSIHFALNLLQCLIFSCHLIQINSHSNRCGDNCQLWWIPRCTLFDGSRSTNDVPTATSTNCIPHFNPILHFTESVFQLSILWLVQICKML